MKRSKHITRKTPLKQKRATRRPSSRVRDTAFLLFVKSLPCSVWEEWPRASACGWEQFATWYPCEGVTEADHDSRGRGLSQKSSDTDAIPMCTLHHAHRTSKTGVFKYTTREEDREWFSRAQRRTRTYWEERNGESVA